MKRKLKAKKKKFLSSWKVTENSTSIMSTDVLTAEMKVINLK